MAGWLWAIPPKHYPTFVKTRTFAIRKVGRAALEQVRAGDTIVAYLSGSKVVAGLFEATGPAFHDATPLVAGGHYPHRVRVRPLVTLSEEAWLPYAAFVDKLDVAAEYDDAFGAVVRQVLHPLSTVDEKVLEFLVRARAADMDRAMTALEELKRARAAEAPAPVVAEAPAAYAPEAFDRGAALETLLEGLRARGFVYAPWEVAAYVTALRTKPFVILAGVTGTGKSRLPALVAEATGGAAHLLPVRPDWTDSSEVLGYVDLHGTFRPGALLRLADRARQHPDRAFVCIVDEMNLARVEHYFAEVLSRLEARRPVPGGFASPPLLGLRADEAPSWSDVGLPPNLGLVGTVNMDESAHTFSRKVLDRAFTLELAAIDLRQRPAVTEAPPPVRWPVAAWQPRATTLAGLGALDEPDAARVEAVIDALEGANAALAPAQLQVAYRTRDEAALFVLHAAATPDAFRTFNGDAVDPLDLAMHMKVLPRLAGGSAPLERALRGLLGWATTGRPFTDPDDARAVVDAWDEADRPDALPDARFPRTAARCALMWARLQADGFTAYWL